MKLPHIFHSWEDAFIFGLTNNHPDAGNYLPKFFNILVEVCTKCGRKKFTIVHYR